MSKNIEEIVREWPLERRQKVDAHAAELIAEDRQTREFKMSIISLMNRYEISAAILLILSKLFGILTAVFIMTSVSSPFYKNPSIICLSCSSACLVSCIILCFVSWEKRNVVAAT